MRSGSIHHPSTNGDRESLLLSVRQIHTADTDEGHPNAGIGNTSAYGSADQKDHASRSEQHAPSLLVSQLVSPGKSSYDELRASRFVS